MLSHIKNISIVCLIVVTFGGVFQIASAASEEELLEVHGLLMEAINAHDMDLWLSYCTENFAFDDVSQPPPMNKAETKAAFELSFFPAFPDFHATPARVMVSGNILVDQKAFTATHMGEYKGIPPTGKSIQMPVLDIFEFEEDKLQKVTVYMDVASMMIQLGLMPAPELDPAILVPSFPLPDAEPTGLTPLEAAEEFTSRWNAVDLAGMAKMIHPDANILIAPLGIPLSRDAYVAVGQMMFQGFSKMPMEVVRAIDMGDGWVVTELLITGTNDGPYMGMPATRKSITLRGVSLQRYNADGLITDLSSYYDNLTMLAQLGLFPPPDPAANKAIASRIFDEIWNQGNLDVADEVLASDLVRHDSGNPDVSGPVGSEGFKQLVSTYRSAFPDIHWTVEDQIAEGDLAASRWTATGTHQGELMGIPPTGASVTGTGISIFRIVNGKATEEWTDWDSMAMMEQLGVMPPSRQEYSWGAASEVTGDPGDPVTNTATVLYFVQKFWNEHNVAGSDNTHSLDFIAHDPATPGHPLPFLVYKQVGLMYLAAFPDFRVTLENVMAEADKVAVRWTVNGTHLGPLVGIPPTGRSITFTGITIHRLADGKIVENWWAYDALGMMQQITAPEPEPPQP